MYIYILISILTLLILATLTIKNINIISYVNIFCIFILFLLVCAIGFYINQYDYISFFNNVIYIDSFSVIELFIISSVSFITSIYSHKYIGDEIKEGIISTRKGKLYYILFDIFIISMLFLSICNNILGMWIGLEATTLSTAFLIGFNNSKLSIEAAWKYIMICSIGIAIGLIGIILFMYSMNTRVDGSMLQWTYLLHAKNTFNKDIVKVAFTFIFVGIGTKAGFAPMHTWLSDGHSEAPSPISAMMSGILINLALYVIIRFYIIVKLIDGLENINYLFIAFGCISLIVSTFSIIKQTNYKRLLAFSSIENIGIMSLGIGFGGTLGVFGYLLHSLIHAYGKTLLFLSAGNILRAYKTKRIEKIKYLIKTMPINSVIIIIGILIITGTPPFASFFSEFNILMQGYNNGHYISVFILVIALLLAFVGFLICFMKMIFSHENIEYKKNDKDNENIFPLILTLGFAVFISITFNNLLYPIINKAVIIICS